MNSPSHPRGTHFLLEHVEPQAVVCPEDMGEDERLLMRALRDFAKHEVVPASTEIDQRNIDVIRPLFKKAADLGIFMAEVPQEHGGLGLNLLAIAGMSECRSAFGGLGSTVFAHQGIGTLPLINFGTQAQIDRYLNRCMNGDLMAAFALTEPDAGTDAMNIKTTAVLNPQGTHYILNGSKQWITNAGWADLFILFAKIDGSAFSAFLLERSTPGLTIGRHERLLGLQGSSVCAIRLDDVSIPIDNLLGEIGKGHRVALCTLNLGRMKMAANCAGSAKHILKTTTGYATERRQFGHALVEFGLIQRKLADMAASTYSAESVAYRTAGLVYAAIELEQTTTNQSLDFKLQTFAEFSAECAMAKVIGSETYHSLSDDALQVYGGYGFSEEYPAARWYRDSRITRIYEGTSEICRLNISKTILKRSSQGKQSFRDAVGRLQSPITRRMDNSLETLQSQTGDLKQLFLFTLGQLWTKLDDSQLLAPANQQFLASVADIAIEIYRAESTILRILKTNKPNQHNDLSPKLALANLVFYNSADRIRQEATEILTALLQGNHLEAALEQAYQWLPVPIGLIESRTTLAQALIESNGTLPQL